MTTDSRITRVLGAFTPAGQGVLSEEDYLGEGRSDKMEAAMLAGGKE